MVSADWSAYHECSGRGSVTSSPGQPFFPFDYYLITLIALRGTGTKSSRFANRFGGDPIVKSIRPLRGILTGRPRLVRD